MIGTSSAESILILVGLNWIQSKTVSWLIWLVGFIWLVSFNQTNKTDQMDQTDRACSDVQEIEVLLVGC